MPTEVAVCANAHNHGVRELKPGSSILLSLLAGLSWAPPSCWVGWFWGPRSCWAACGLLRLAVLLLEVTLVRQCQGTHTYKSFIGDLTP